MILLFIFLLANLILGWAGLVPMCYRDCATDFDQCLSSEQTNIGECFDAKKLCYQNCSSV